MVHGSFSMVLFLAFRYLFSTRQRFVPLLAGTTFLGMTLGVFFLVVVLSVMSGFQRELSKRWIGLNAHWTIHAEPKAISSLLPQLQKFEEIEEVQKYAEGEVILQTQREEETLSVAAKLKGVDRLSPSFYAQVELYPPREPAWPRLAGEKRPPLLAGGELLSALGVHPDYPETVSMVFPFGEIGPAGDFVPKTKKFLPTHAFKTGLYAWDAYTVLVPFEEAIALLGDFAETGLHVRLKNLGDLEGVGKGLAKILPKEAELESFEQQNAKLFNAMKLERGGMSLLLVLFLLVASFSIAGLLLMFLFSKQRDMAVLRAIGLSPADAKRVYWTLGGLLGGAGALTGSLLGLLCCYLLYRYPIALPSTYYLNVLPVHFSWLVIFGGMGIGVFLSLLAGRYPATQVSRMEILPALREE